MAKQNLVEAMRARGRDFDYHTYNMDELLTAKKTFQKLVRQAKGWVMRRSVGDMLAEVEAEIGRRK